MTIIVFGRSLQIMHHFCKVVSICCGNTYCNNASHGSQIAFGADSVNILRQCSIRKIHLLTKYSWGKLVLSFEVNCTGLVGWFVCCWIAEGGSNCTWTHFENLYQKRNVICENGNIKFVRLKYEWIDVNVWLIWWCQTKDHRKDESADPGTTKGNNTAHRIVVPKTICSSGF